MSNVISDDLLQQIHMTENEFRQEIAFWLFQKEKMTLAQASNFAGMNRIQFQHLLANRQIPVHYDIEDFDKDLSR